MNMIQDGTHVSLNPGKTNLNREAAKHAKKFNSMEWHSTLIDAENL